MAVRSLCILTFFSPYPFWSPFGAVSLSREGEWGRFGLGLGLGGFDAIWCCGVCGVASVCDLTGLRDLRFSVGVGS